MVIMAIVGGYVLTSLLLLKYPGLLHKKKNVKFCARHISHRGGAGENLENTMTAFKHACHLGTQMLELDCHLTLDGQVVVSHDNCLLRICGCEMLISQTDYKDEELSLFACGQLSSLLLYNNKDEDDHPNDLPSLKPELPLDFNPNIKIFPVITPRAEEDVIVGSADRHIPLLEEVFQTFPNMPINIDIKVNDGNLIEKVSALIKKYNREEITVWGNKQQAISTKCYKCNPNIPLIFSLRRVLILLALYYSGLLPFVPLRETFLEIVMPSIILDETKSLVDLSRKKRLFIKFCDILLMRPSLFKHLEKRGIQVYLWVLNDEEEFARGFSLGATGIMTDYPTKLLEFLQKNPQYRNR